jgi:Flp pilus assembly protein TadD
MKIGRLKESLAVLEETIKLFPNYAPALNSLGVTLLELRRYREAKAAFTRALELSPETERVRYNLALSNIALKNKEAALQQYHWLKAANADLAQKLYQIIYQDLIVKVNTP